jgi:DNA-directed RNA polymerase subunit RPC12/RpoP
MSEGLRVGIGAHARSTSRVIYRCRNCDSTNLSPMDRDGRWLYAGYRRCRDCGYQGSDFSSEVIGVKTYIP